MRNSLVGLVIWRETLKKPSKRETHTISPKICQEKVKNVNNEKYTLQDLDYCQNTINVENETKTQLDPEYAEKH